MMGENVTFIVLVVIVALLSGCVQSQPIKDSDGNDSINGPTENGPVRNDPLLQKCLEDAEELRRRACEELGVPLDEFGNCVGIDIADPSQQCYENDI